MWRRPKSRSFLPIDEPKEENLIRKAMVESCKARHAGGCVGGWEVGVSSPMRWKKLHK